MTKNFDAREQFLNERIRADRAELKKIKRERLLAEREKKAADAIAFVERIGPERRAQIEQRLEVEAQQKSPQ